MAGKTVLVSDISGEEIADGRGATVRITFRDARKGVRELDVTEAEAERFGGRAVGASGRAASKAARTAPRQKDLQAATSAAEKTLLIASFRRDMNGERTRGGARSA
jgi:hypothetical protein